MEASKREIFLEEKKKIDLKYEKQYKEEVIRNKISFSEKKNEANLMKINKKNVYINEVVEGTKQKLIKFSDPNNKQYQQLLKKLIVQGMAQMLEQECILRVRKQDHSFVQSILGECEKEFEKVLKDATSREYHCKISIDQKELNTQLGGVHLFDKTLKIQCTNDLESRLELSYTKLLPDLKKQMFQ